jgi:hypothetical protein
MASASGTPYSMEGGHGSSSIQIDDADQEASGGFFATDTTRLVTCLGDPPYSSNVLGG